MNLVLVWPGEIGPDRTVDMDGRRATHLREVLRAEVGDELRVGVLGRGIGRGRVVSMTSTQVSVEVEEAAVTAEVARPGPADLVLAVPRPKALSRVLQTAASFAVGAVDLVNAWRVDKAYFSSPRLQPDQLEHAAILGCEQGAVTWLPTLATHRRLMPALDSLPDPDTDDRRRIIAHPRAARPIEAVVRPGGTERVLAAVGPEGGWIDRELTAFVDRGFEPVNLGASVLRVEAAIPALLSVIELLRRLPGREFVVHQND